MDELLLINRAAEDHLSPKPSKKEHHHPNPDDLSLHLLSSNNKSGKQSTRIFSRRSHSSPCIFTDIKRTSTPGFVTKNPNSSLSTPPIVKHTITCVILYIAIGVIVYMATDQSFEGHSTFRLVDALYFTIVTLCTIGYGDIVPCTASTKLFMCLFILAGFGFVDILLNGLVSYVLDKQEEVLLSAMDQNQRNNPVFRTYVMDMKKRRVRVRMKVGLAIGVVIGCIAVGVVMVHVLEGLNWVDSFYLSVTSVTTVGYGDYAFRTVKGRLFAAAWLLVSTLAVARAFLFLAELRIDKRNRRVAEWVLQKEMTVGDLVAADLDNDGSISKSEYVIYKLKEMGKIAEKDILDVCNQFDRLDARDCRKITLSDLIEAHH